MPIRPYLAGRTFPPETVAVMGTAFDEACATLGLAGTSLTRAMVAETIISLVAHDGHTDAAQVAAAAVHEIRGTKSMKE